MLVDNFTSEIWNNLRHLLELAVVLLSVLRFSLTCTCVGITSQNAFCDADYAVRAYVMRETVRRRELAIPGDDTAIPINDRLYMIYVVNVFKRVNVTIRFIDEIVTPESSAACGTRLAVGEWYLITGNVLSGEKSVIQCNWYQEWSRLSSCQQNALFYGLYESNCDCKVSTCDGMICYPHHQTVDNNCIIRSNITSDRCLNAHAVCLRDGRGRCTWARCPSSISCF